MSKIEDVLVVQKVEIEVEIPLTEEMAEHRGAKLAALGRDIRRLRALAKDESASRRAEIKKADETIADLEKQIDTKTARVMVPAERRPHFDTNTWVTVRMDPEGYGIIHSETAMTADERQLAIDVDAELPPREPPKQVQVKRKAKADAEPATH